MVWQDFRLSAIQLHCCMRVTPALIINYIRNMHTYVVSPSKFIFYIHSNDCVENGFVLDQVCFY